MNETPRDNHRIRTAKDFELIFKKGNHKRGKNINLWVYEGGAPPSAATAGPRLGVVVSKKVDRRASRRNTWKRRIREAWRLCECRIPKGAMALIQARPVHEPAAFSAIKAELDALLTKMGF